MILASRPPINEIVERSVTMIWFEIDAIGVDCLISFALKSGTIILNGDAAAKTPRICSWLFPKAMVLPQVRKMVVAHPTCVRFGQLSSATVVVPMIALVAAVAKAEVFGRSLAEEEEEEVAEHTGAGD